MPSKSVLVAVEDALIRWALEKELSAHGIEAQAVETGADALERTAQTEFGIAFVDLGLPDTDGLKLLESIGGSSPDTRLVLFGCDVHPTVKRAAFDRGAWQVVEKPFVLKDLIGLVRSVFGPYERTRLHRRYLCRLPLRLQLLAASSDSGTDLDAMRCNTLDIGPGGMRIRIDTRLRVGQRLRAHVLLPQDPCAARLPKNAEAEVVWLGTRGTGFTGGLRWLSASTPGRTS